MVLSYLCTSMCLCICMFRALCVHNFLSVKESSDLHDSTSVPRRRWRQVGSEFVPIGKYYFELLVLLRLEPPPVRCGDTVLYWCTVSSLPRTICIRDVCPKSIIFARVELLLTWWRRTLSHLRSLMKKPAGISCLLRCRGRPGRPYRWSGMVSMTSVPSRGWCYFQLKHFLRIPSWWRWCLHQVASTHNIEESSGTWTALFECPPLS